MSAKKLASVGAQNSIPPRLKVLWCPSGRCQHQIPTTPVHIGNTHDIACVASVICSRPRGLSRHQPHHVLLTSLLPFEHVSQQFGRYVACGVLWQRTLCWRCFVHSSSPKLTVTAQYWPESLCHSLIDSSQCSTLLLVSCFRQDGQNLWRHFSVTLHTYIHIWNL